MNDMRQVRPFRSLRPVACRNPSLAASQAFPTRCYASRSDLGAAPMPGPGPKRRRVTIFNDNGAVPWKELSVAEKTSRAMQQSVNLGMILLGLTLTGAVGYFMWTDVFSPDSKITQFNRAVNRIKKDPRCLELLGDASRITAHGEATMNKWRRARPLACVFIKYLAAGLPVDFLPRSSEKTDGRGNDHLLMRFHVEGPLNKGIAQFHLVKRRGKSDYSYKHFFVDVEGCERIYLEKAESKPDSGKKQLNFLGIKWS